MHPRFHTFAQAFRTLRQCTQPGQAGQRPRIASFICQSCQPNFSPTSSLTALRNLAQASRRRLTTAAQNVKDKQYAKQIIIYQAGSHRTALIGTWKAVALFQFGVCTVWGAPRLYSNENQPDKNIRIFQAIGVTLLSTLPSLILTFLTAPYVTAISLHPIPPQARRSLTALRAFAASLPRTTRITFQTLRTFPMPKHTTCYVHELRALPPRRFGFANILLNKSNKMEGWRRKLWSIVEERRNKFYVREGTVETVRTGVPGVWEAVARGIGEKTQQEKEEKDGKKAGSKASAGKSAGTPRPMPVVKRQTARRL